jgi:hypothetical protein
MKQTDDFAVKDIIYTTLVKADIKALKLITANIEVFIEQMKQVAERKGVKWDDVCVRHEWNVEMS